MSWAKKIRERNETSSLSQFCALIGMTRQGLSRFEGGGAKRIARLVTLYHKLSGLSADEFLALLRKDSRKR